MAHVRFVDSVPNRLLGVFVIALAVPFTASSWYFLRHPGWRREGWWARHPGMTKALIGPPWADRFGAVFGLTAGVLMIVGGLVVVIIG